MTSSLVRERRDGVRETLAFHYEGKYLNSPNDVTVRSDGTIYFSDPWYGRFPGFGIERGRELGWQGVFRIPPGGGQDELELAVAQDEFDMPNGLCFSPDESLLYINDTPRAHIKVFDVERRRVALERTDVLRRRRHRRDRGGHPGRDEVRRARQHLGHRARRRLGDLARRRAPRHGRSCPRTSATTRWGGPDWHTLFIPSCTSVYTIRTTVGPRREPYMA